MKVILTLLALFFFTSCSSGNVEITVKKPELKWKFATEPVKTEIDQIFSEISADQNIFYFSSDSGVIYALDSKSGKIKWSFNTNGEVYTKPVINKNSLYVVSKQRGENFLYVLELETGKELTKERLSEITGDINSIFIYKNCIYFTEARIEMIYAFDIDSFEKKWQFNPYGEPNSIVFKDHQLFFSTSSASLYCLNAMEGFEYWKLVSTGGNRGVTACPIISNEIIYFIYSPPFGDGKLESDISYLCAVNLNYPESLLWKFNLQDRGGVSSIFLLQNNLFICGQNFIYAIDCKNGTKKWDKKFNEEENVEYYLDFYLYENRLFIITSNGRIISFEPETGNENLIQKLPKGIIDGNNESFDYRLIKIDSQTIYLRDFSNLYALNKNSGKVEWQFNGGKYTIKIPKEISSLTLYSDTLYASGGSDGTIYLLDPKEGKEKSRFKKEGSVRSYSVFDNTLYIALHENKDDVIYAIDLKTGKDKWKKVIVGDEIIKQIKAYKNFLIYSTMNEYNPELKEISKLTVINANTGNKVWDLSVGKEEILTCNFLSDFVIKDDIIYFIGSTGTAGKPYENVTLYSVNIVNGKEKWNFSISNIYIEELTFSSCPIIYGNYIYIFANFFKEQKITDLKGCDGYLYCIDIENGIKKWELLVNKCIDKNRIISSINNMGLTRNNIYLHVTSTSTESNNKFIHSLLIVNTISGNCIKSIDFNHSFSIVEDKIIYGVDFEQKSKMIYNSRIYASDLEKGKELWNYYLEDKITSSLLIHKDMLYFGTTEGYIYMRLNKMLSIFDSISFYTDGNNKRVSTVLGGSLGDLAAITDTPDSGIIEQPNKDWDIKYEVDEYGNVTTTAVDKNGNPIKLAPEDQAILDSLNKGINDAIKWLGDQGFTFNDVAKSKKEIMNFINKYAEAFYRIAGGENPKNAYELAYNATVGKAIDSKMQKYSNSIYDYNRYDQEIGFWVSFWTRRAGLQLSFSRKGLPDLDTPASMVDLANIIKTIAYQESHVGFDPECNLPNSSGMAGIMQVPYNSVLKFEEGGDPGQKALYGRGLYFKKTKETGFYVPFNNIGIGAGLLFAKLTIHSSYPYNSEGARRPPTFGEWFEAVEFYGPHINGKPDPNYRSNIQSIVFKGYSIRDEEKLFDSSEYYNR